MNRTRKASRSEYVFSALVAVSILWIDAGAKTEPLKAVSLPPRMERFSTIETLKVGDFAVELCRRDDGAFGLGNVVQGTLPLRRADSLITWQVDGEFPAFERRDGSTVFLREPSVTLTFTPQRRQCAGTTFDGFQMELKTQGGVVVETASWELGGSTQGLSYFDGYRGWHAPPHWQQADAVSPTNPKLLPSLLAGGGLSVAAWPTRGAIALPQHTG